MKDISISQGYMYATVIEGVLYGFNLASLIAYIFVFDNKRQFARRVVQCSVYLLFVLSTAHLAGSVLSFSSLEEGFFVQSQFKSSDVYFSNKALPLNLINRSLYGAVMVIGDALLIYRVWAIYEKSWKVVILPVLTHLGTLACTIHIIWGLSQLKPGQTIYNSSVSTTAPAMFVLPFVTNVTITAFIVVRIRQAKDAIGHLSTISVGLETTDVVYKRVIWGVIESCAIYPAFLSLAIVLYVLKTNALALVTGPISQVVSIVPVLMWLQVALGYSQYEAAVKAAGLPAETTTNAPGSFGRIELQTRMRRDHNGDAAGGIVMVELEEGCRSRKFNARA